MKALITGASSGIGWDMAAVLAERGCDLIVVARRADKLEELKKSLDTRVDVIFLDLSKRDECMRLYETVKAEEIDILINNAGFGVFGSFNETELQKELAMIETNIEAVHILTKLFLKDFVKQNSGYILNVASAAAFLPGPLMAAYYASKAYVLRLTQAVAQELRSAKSDVYIGALCPGPVETEFNSVANAKFAVKGLESGYVARYAINKMFARKHIIVPGAMMKTARFLSKAVPDCVLAMASHRIQSRKK